MEFKLLMERYLKRSTNFIKSCVGEHSKGEPIMKKTMMTLALVAVVGLTGINMAEAQWGGGWMRGNGGYGPGACNGPGGWGGNTSATYENIEKFHNDTADLRKQMFEKRSEYYEAINQENPDKELAKELWGQLFDLRQQMHEKAVDSGMKLPGYGMMQPGYGMRGRF
jgi:Spy/CpxP family protein refolding chaperone